MDWEMIFGITGLVGGLVGLASFLTLLNLRSRRKRPGPGPHRGTPFTCPTCRGANLMLDSLPSSPDTPGPTSRP